MEPAESAESIKTMFWVLGGYGIVLFYLLIEQFKTNKQVAVITSTLNQQMGILQKTVDLVNHNLNVFLRTELDQLKEIAVDRNNGRA